MGAGSRLLVPWWRPGGDPLGLGTLLRIGTWQAQCCRMVAGAGLSIRQELGTAGVNVNAPGFKRRRAWVVPRYPGTPLYHFNGQPTGVEVPTDWLLYTDDLGNGKLRLDYQERHVAGGKTLVFFQAGNGMVLYTIPSGHVWIADLMNIAKAPDPPSPWGQPVTVTGQHYRVVVTSMPPDALYKPASPGSMYQTYAWPQVRWGDLSAPKTTYLCWSWINVAGGGLVRGVIPDGAVVAPCKVAPLHWPMWNIKGQQTGEVSARYVKVAGKYGWLLWAHRLNEADDWTRHVKPD
jgi:hypothetical protein